MLKQNGVTRRQLLGGLVGTVALSATPALAAPNLLVGAGDIRKIHMISNRTGERVKSVYWVEGQYIPEVLEEISFFMRDWRQDEIIDMDPRLIDIMSAAHHMMDTTEPYQMLSGYRSQRTNNLLRRSNSGVASNSYHIKGMAADLRISGRTTYQMSKAARTCRSGGVGRYRSSGFVHMHCGPIRSWNG